MPYRFNEPRRHKIPRARYRVQNWPAYEQALQRRGDLTVWVTPEAIAAWCPPRTGWRPRPYHGSVSWDDPFGPEGRDGDQAVNAGVNASDTTLE
jgi:hypothetical protein